MKLLVPTNFSKISEDALSTAVALYHKINNCTITLLHFEKTSANNVFDIDSEQTQLDPKKLEEYQQYLKNAKESYPSVRMSFVSIAYVSEADLFNQIEGLKSDLIVMGTQEVERYENERLVGEHTKKFIKNLQTPIFCLREKIANANFKKVVFASNLKESQIADFNKLNGFLTELQLSIEVVLVVTPDKFITTEKALRAFEASSKTILYPNITFKIYNEIGVAEGIIGYCQNNKVDLLIMPTHGRKGLDKFFNGSISEIVLDEIRIPIISILD
ncbi:MAG TPA: universal stress protein [Cytophagales bacterium]|nr:universal stress protein [Cytophagales bacterium]